MSGKLFCVGFHKTATKSLGKALEILGYKTCGPIGVANPRISVDVFDVIAPYLQDYDAFQDNPWPLLYRELDARFPASKFILTLRPVDEWYASVCAHFGGKTTPMREWIYGVGDPINNRQCFVDRYARHNEDVKHYFADRPEDFLMLNITQGEGWEPLCRFLGKPVPKEPFPTENTKNSRLDFT